MNSKYISYEYFKKRMVDLCLRSGITDFPEKRQDKQILLKSIVNGFDPDKVYSEVQVNEFIKSWLTLSPFSDWDFMMLRRILVDEGFLSRNKDGSGYWLSNEAPVGIEFDSAIAQFKMDQFLSEQRQLIAQRKAAYSNLSQS